MPLAEAPPTRRRNPRSISVPAAVDPVDLLDRVVEGVHVVNRVLPGRVLGREELVALGGLLTQVSAALSRLTDLLAAPTASCDRVRGLRVNANGSPSATDQLLGCREGYARAGRSARALHGNLKRYGA